MLGRFILFRRVKKEFGFDFTTKRIYPSTITKLINDNSIAVPQSPQKERGFFNLCNPRNLWLETRKKIPSQSTAECAERAQIFGINKKTAHRLCD